MSDPLARLRAVVTRLAVALGHDAADVRCDVVRRPRRGTRRGHEWRAWAYVYGEVGTIPTPARCLDDALHLGCDTAVSECGPTADAAVDAAITALRGRIEERRARADAAAQRAAARAETLARGIAAMEGDR